MNQARLCRTTGVLAAVAFAGLWAGNASAIPSVVIQQATGTDAGPQETDGGPGHEQASVTWLQKDGKTYIVNIYMSSKVSEGNWHCKCSSVELSADGQPKTVADQVQLTFGNNGDRLCNHPKAASDGERVVWVYGSDANSNNPRTYVSSVNEMCQPLSEPLRISENGNNNEGAPDITYNGNGRFTAGYLSTNNNDTSFAVGLEVLDLGGGQIELQKNWLTGVVTPSNIGRPTIVPMNADYSLFCAAKGDNRPPEDGVQCAKIDAKTGQVMFKQIIAASEPEQKIYHNQPTLVALGSGYFLVRTLESSGEGKTDNKKGANTAHDWVISPGVDSFQINAHEKGLGSFATHSTVCSGAYGDKGEMHFGAFGSAITGNGQPTIRFYNYTTSVQADVNHNTWIAGWYADAGKLANMYGHNPNTQGRDFLRCIGDVPNPAFGNKDGFLPSVKTFFVIPHAGRIPGEEKNSQFLGLVPGWTSKPVEADPPADVNDVELGEQGEGPTDSEPPVAEEPTDPDPVDPGGDEPTVVDPKTSAGCAMSPGADYSGLAVLAVGLGLALGARRRKGV